MVLLTENKQYRIEIIPPHSAICVLEISTYLRNGLPVAESNHRICLFPGDDIQGQPASVTAVAEALWTENVVAEYRSHVAELAAAQSSPQSAI